MRAGFPVAVRGMRVGLFGGSFDPPHEGHLRVAAEALKRFGLDRVWFLVTPGNPLKAHQPAPLAQRLATLHARLVDPRMVPTGVEAALGTRNTADTIARLQALYPGVRFAWIMGADNLAQFHLWDRWSEIAARVPIGVVARPGAQLAARVSVTAQVLARNRLRGPAARRLADARPPAWAMIDIPMSDASSSEIRARAGR